MGTAPDGEQGDQPGVGDALRRVRDGGRKLADAHIELLKAELAVAGRELGIVIGMAVAIVALAVVAGLLLVIGTSLFLGEWLFGSMAWGIVHGVLFFVALIVPLALDLAGGRRDAFVRGLAAGVVTTLLLWALFASNVLRDTAVNVGRSLETSLAIEPAFLPTLVGLVAGMVVLGIAGLILGWRRGGVAGLLVLGLVIGAAMGAVLGSVTFDTKGALAVALVVGLITWIGVTVLVAVRTGFDPEGRYEAMVPRETMAMAQETKEFLERQWRRQRGKVLGR
jgi:MFS family permease